MTASGLRGALESLRWSQRTLAAALRRPHNTIHRWATGEQEIPPEVADWLTYLSRVVESNPPPV